MGQQILDSTSSNFDETEFNRNLPEDETAELNINNNSEKEKLPEGSGQWGLDKSQNA